MSGNAQAIRLGVLGPLSIRVDGVAIPVPAAKQRAVLGTLLVRANQVVSFEELAEIVWDGSPPRAARATVGNYVKRLRHALGPAIGARIVTHDPGYLVEVGDEELDRLGFAALCRARGEAVRTGAWLRASELLGQALALWRGPALVDVQSETLRLQEVPRLDRLRLQASEWRVEAELQLGLHDQTIDELQPLVAEHPLHERFHGQLMLALARSGRRAEALEAYRRARRVVVDELGIEPGPELRELHGRILRGDPDLGQHADGPPRRSVAVALVPRQLPAPVRHFTGRLDELEALNALLDQAADGATTLVISSIEGMAGIGKTALATTGRSGSPRASPTGSST